MDPAMWQSSAQLTMFPFRKSDREPCRHDTTNQHLCFTGGRSFELTQTLPLLPSALPHPLKFPPHPLVELGDEPKLGL